MKKIFLLLVFVFIHLLTSCKIGNIFSPFEEQNQLKEEIRLYSEIFNDINYDNSIFIIEDLTDPAITKKVVAKDANGELLGYIYTVAGENSYGPISLLVGIGADGKLVSAEFLENGQSYGKQVETHVNSSYTSGLTLEEISNINTSCGATYGANTVKELVTIAFNDYNNGGAE